MTSNSSELQATRTLNVELPAAVYWHIRECATLSRMSLKEFMSEFGRSAQPIVQKNGLSPSSREN